MILKLHNNKIKNSSDIIYLYVSLLNKNGYTLQGDSHANYFENDTIYKIDPLKHYYSKDTQFGICKKSCYLTNNKYRTYITSNHKSSYFYINFKIYDISARLFVPFSSLNEPLTKDNISDITKLYDWYRNEYGLSGFIPESNFYKKMFTYTVNVYYLCYNNNPTHRPPIELIRYESDDNVKYFLKINTWNKKDPILHDIVINDIITYITDHVGNCSELHPITISNCSFL